MSTAHSSVTLPPLPVKEGVEYRHVPGMPGLCAGTDGSIWSCIQEGIKKGQPRAYQGFIHNWRRHYGTTSNGYLRSGFRRNKMISHHRLILLAFVGKCPEGMECRHLNGIRVDNRISNLRWGTRKENASDRIVHRTSGKGQLHPQAKLKDRDILKIRELALTGMTQRAIAELFGVTQVHIGYIVNRRIWKHI